jgi:uncharacterized protein YaaW (UPF0174 family)
VEDVIPYVSPAVLRELVQVLEWQPSLWETPLSTLSAREQEAYLANKRSELMGEISRVGGHSIANTFRGHGVPYIEIVRDLAERFKVEHSPWDSVGTIETNLILRLWNTTIKQLTPEQLQELKKRATEEAGRFGKSALPEAAWIGALSAAQLSGFGVYLISTTILGAISSALGLGLGMGVFVGLTKLISVLIGPVGWICGPVALGLIRFGAPNYKKLLPVVLLIGAYREHVGTKVNRALRRVNGVEGFCEFLLRIPDPPTLYELHSAIMCADYNVCSPRYRDVLVAMAEALSPSTSIEQIDALADKLVSLDSSEEESRVYEVFCKYHPDAYDLLLYRTLRRCPSRARSIYLKSPEFGDAHLLALKLIGMESLRCLRTNSLMGESCEQ